MDGLLQSKGIKKRNQPTNVASVIRLKKMLEKEKERERNRDRFKRTRSKD